jgi:hypothetical protein
VVPEAELEQTDAGVVPAGAGWFVVYTVDEAALRHGASVEVETTDATVAYARFAPSTPARYRDGWLPGR